MTGAGNHKKTNHQEKGNTKTGDDSIHETALIAAITTGRMRGPIVGEVIKPGVDSRVYNTGAKTSEEAWKRG